MRMEGRRGRRDKGRRGGRRGGGGMRMEGEESEEG